MAAECANFFPDSFPFFILSFIIIVYFYFIQEYVNLTYKEIVYLNGGLEDCEKERVDEIIHKVADFIGIPLFYKWNQY